MRFSAGCSLSVVVACAALAGEPAAQPEGLGELLDRMAASAGVEAAFFERKELALLAAPLESRGVIYFAPPDRFARFTSSPGFSALLVDGESVRLREGREDDEIDLSKSPVARGFVENFVALWSGDRERLEHLYTAEFHGTEVRWELRLVPRRAPLSQVIASITLRGDSEAMREMVVEERDGDRTSTFFESTQSDRAFAPQELHRIFVAGEPLNRVSAEP